MWKYIQRIRYGVYGDCIQRASEMSEMWEHAHMSRWSICIRDEGVQGNMEEDG